LRRNPNGAAQFFCSAKTEPSANASRRRTPRARENLLLCGSFARAIFATDRTIAELALSEESGPFDHHIRKRM